METMIKDKKDQEKIIALVKESNVLKVWKEHFTEYLYDDVYFVALGAGERSSIGIKRMITGRLNKLPAASPDQQKDIIDEISELVQCLYDRQKELQGKIGDIRKVIEK